MQLVDDVYKKEIIIINKQIADLNQLNIDPSTKKKIQILLDRVKENHSYFIEKN